MSSTDVQAPSRRRFALAGICLGAFAVWVTSSSLNLDLAHIQRSLGGSSSGLEWVVNAYTLSFAVLLLTAGTVGDRIGHRRAFLYGLSIFGVASPLCSEAPTLALLIVARFVQGAEQHFWWPTQWRCCRTRSTTVLSARKQLAFGGAFPLQESQRGRSSVGSSWIPSDGAACSGSMFRLWWPPSS